MTCQYCTDPDGVALYPYWGLAPHTHKSGPIIGSTEMSPKEAWPENFQPSEPEDGKEVWEGVYTHCLECGDGGES